MNEQEMRELFRQMRDEPVPADSLARVRGRVEERIGKRHRWKIFVPALAAASCVLAVFLMLKPAKAPVQVQPPSLPEIAREIAEVQPPPEVPVRAVPRPKRARPRPVETVPVSIRIETADPNVVILLVN